MNKSDSTIGFFTKPKAVNVSAKIPVPMDNSDLSSVSACFWDISMRIFRSSKNTLYLPLSYKASFVALRPVAASSFAIALCHDFGGGGGGGGGTAGIPLSPESPKNTFSIFITPNQITLIN